MFTIKPLKRQFLPQDFKVTTWAAIQPFADDLLNRSIGSLADYKKFLADFSELTSILSEDSMWRYVQKSRDTGNPVLKEHYEDYIKHIDPPYSELANKLNHKISDSPFAAQVSEAGFEVMFKKLQTQMAIFREENIPLATEISDLSSEVDALRGAMQITLDGKDLTMQEVEDRLFLPDRAKREEAWKALRDRLREEKGNLDRLYDAMFQRRQVVAKNAGFANYRDYKFAEYNRFDYTPADCAAFHEGIRTHMLPVLKDMYQVRKEQLGVQTLYPWDLAVDPFNRAPVIAFDSQEDLLDKLLRMLDPIDTAFGDIIRNMRENDRFDLMSRPGKQPGGYNAPMYESNISYIFTNFTSKVDDVVTMTHEAGHAIHEAMMYELPLVAYRDYPMEVAELGSMTMELLCGEHWDVFCADKKDFYRARREHLEDILMMLAWIAIVDEFQHGVYTQENPSIENRHTLWAELCAKYATGNVEADNYAHPTRIDWHKQNHIFDLPFYYIDYGIARLGSLQIYRNYKKDPQKTVQQFKYALSLGGTRSRPEIYQAAGIEFNFSSEMLQDVMQFVGSEITRLGELEMAAE